MSNPLKLVWFCLLMPILSSAQSPFRIVSDFPISSDTNPSTFLQRDIRLFPKPDSGFLAAWVDER
ncbi:MAG: hypothetical protein HYZ33_02510, partial [Ignavibacteriales bacterium]|nr:hypothetical protein [Ignavibacteriales bacterium]